MLGKIKRFALASVLLLASCFLYASTPDEVTKWVEGIFAKGQEPPFSFVLDEVPSSEFIKGWKRTEKTLPPREDGQILRQFSYSDGKLLFTADVTIWPASNAVEWLVHVKNVSGENSGRISSLKGMDVNVSFPQKGDIKLHYAEGNKISKADYAPRTKLLRTGEPLHLSPVSGRSSEEEFPFFCIESEVSARGIMLSIGWTGTWALDMEKLNPSVLSLTSGQKTLDTYLKPSEEIRTPSYAVLFWKGERINGHNAFRRFIIEHHSRTVDGKVDYPLCSGFNYRDPQPFGEYSAITSDWAVAMIERYAQFGLLPDVFWMDAGWHTGASDYKHGKNWANTTGNWTVDAERFPNGLKPISEAAHKYGAKYMVWFEPERVVRGTQWSAEHPQWMLEATWPEGSEESTWQLFNLADDQACDWLCNYYGDLIEQNGIDYYRQDANVKPAKYWAENDDPERRGMLENKYVCNLYRYWDYLLERFPGLLIDNCASGGKRLDWETIGRSAPLWRSDYYHYNDPDGYQCHTYGLNFFLPVHGTGILLPDQYSFRSSLSSALVYNWKITESGNSIIEMQQRISEYREIKPYYYEDYYPLSGTDKDLTGDDVWLAYQMHRPSDESGIIIAFRRSKSPDCDYKVTLGGLDPDTSYLLTDADSGKTIVADGSSLADGYVLHLDNPGTSLLIKYRKNE